MSLINIAARLTESITYKRPTSHTAFGDSVLGAAVVVPARIERGLLNSPDNEGRKTDDDTTIFTLVELRPSDMIWLPEADTGNANEGRLVTSVERRKALDGTTTHYVSRIG